MKLCLDSGNSRLKWALHDGQHWCRQGVIDRADIAQLPGQLADLPPVAQIIAANVAGEAVASLIRQAAASLNAPLIFASSQAVAAGVRNGYTRPEQLGVDRWCALLGARHHHAGNCLVVGLGTATTIDFLSDKGDFSGGLILPGLTLMQQALASGTAQLPLAEGGWQARPKNTADAIVSGCLEAQAGAIERAYARLADPEALCLLFGGVAPLVRPLLAIPCREEALLVLDGLRQMAD